MICCAICRPFKLERIGLKWISFESTNIRSGRHRRENRRRKKRWRNKWKRKKEWIEIIKVINTLFILHLVRVFCRCCYFFYFPLWFCVLYFNLRWNSIYMISSSLFPRIECRLFFHYFCEQTKTKRECMLMLKYGIAMQKEIITCILKWGLLAICL